MVIFPSWKEILLYAVGLLMLFDYVEPIKLIELQVPNYLPLGTRAALSCRWQLGPGDVLYSVKWYKDGKEFFRHVPRDVEPRRKFPLPGVDVEDSDTSGSRVVLSSASTDTGGRYRCEVSGEKPLFPTVSEHKDLAVVVMPDHGPTLSGFKPKYRIGDMLRVSCSSGRSQPATQLSWYINGEPLPLEETTASYRSDNGLIVTTLTLEVEVTEEHFKNNILNVKCLATITPIYWKSNEESALREKSINDHEILIIGMTDDDLKAEHIQANCSTKFSNCLYKYVAFLCVFLVKMSSMYL